MSPVVVLLHTQVYVSQVRPTCAEIPPRNNMDVGGGALRSGLVALDVEDLERGQRRCVQRAQGVLPGAHFPQRGGPLENLEKLRFERVSVSRRNVSTAS